MMEWNREKYTYPYQDPDCEGNSPRYHYGRPCIMKGCNNPAGTLWSPLFCFECNVKRMDKINDSLEELLKILPEEFEEGLE